MLVVYGSPNQDDSPRQYWTAPDANKTGPATHAPEQRWEGLTSPHCLSTTLLGRGHRRRPGTGAVDQDGWANSLRLPSRIRGLRHVQDEYLSAAVRATKWSRFVLTDNTRNGGTRSRTTQQSGQEYYRILAHVMQRLRGIELVSYRSTNQS